MSPSFGSTTTTDEVTEGVRLDGRHVVVTGGTGGLGLETARALAAVGAAVTITGRNDDKIAAARSTLAEQVPGAEINSANIDLASLASVAAGAAAICDGPAIDVLVNNAGVMMCPPMRTADGFEMQIGTNHLGHFAFTAQIAPALAAGARVVTVSSGAHLRDAMDLDDLNWDRREYDKMGAYAQSKTANIWFASELQRRRPDLLSLSLHPGAIMTDLGRHLTAEDIEAMRSGAKASPSGNTDPMPMKSIPEGAATSVWAATAAELTGHGGAYLANCGIAQPLSDDVERGAGYAPWAYDVEGAGRLWDISNELTGLSFCPTASTS